MTLGRVNEKKGRKRKMWGGVGSEAVTSGQRPPSAARVCVCVCARIRRGKATKLRYPPCDPPGLLRPHPGFRGRILEKRRPGRHWPLREHRLSSANRGPS